MNRVANYAPAWTGGNGEGPRLGGVMPHSPDAEMGVLGSMLQDQSALEQALDRLRPEHFFIPANRSTFVALGAFYRQKKPLDLITFTEAFKDGLRIRQDPNDPGYMLRIEEVGGLAYVMHLFTFVPTGANVSSYLDILREKLVARQIIAKCTEITRVARDEQAEISQILEQAQATLTQIIIETERTEVIVHVREGVGEAVKQLERAYSNRYSDAVLGLATGIIDLDRMTAGLREQQLVIVGARPSQGKTALAMNFASNMAVLNKVPVGVFSMEMSYQEVVNRLVSNNTGISLQRFRDGLLTDAVAADLNRAREAFDEGTNFAAAPEGIRKMVDAPLWIDESPALSIASFKARARLMRTRYGVRAIVVDYLQLMTSGSKRSQESLRIEITEISAALKATAKELEIPIICCAQLNREAEGREFGKPKMSELRESGSIEQDADIVLLLWRPARHIQYPKNEGLKGEKNKLAKILHLRGTDGEELWEESKDKDDERLTKEQKDERTRQLNEYAELILAKQRNGPVNNIRLKFVDELTRFENVTKKRLSNREDERQQT